MIGQFGERNVVRMSAAVTFGGTLRDIQKTAARETRSPFQLQALDYINQAPFHNTNNTEIIWALKNYTF